ncbi:hypothetical protein CPB85DRAFT_668796 [Mucidula mucida]|nr:hypothetical protein CPB85DRAFT_668796 [Mucidula mucida]
MLSTLTRFGFLENAVAYDDRDGENEVLNVVFFDERASSSFFQSVIDDKIPGLEGVTIRYSLDPSVNKKRITEGKEEIRRVDIDLREAGMPTSTATLLMRVNHLLASELQVGERVPVISRNDSKVSLFFLYPFYAQKFYELAQDFAKHWGVTLQLASASSMSFFLKKAILAGACRTLKLRLDREVSEQELYRDFFTFVHRPGRTDSFDDLRIEMRRNVALIEYNDIYHALKAVHGLTSGFHTLGERYTGMEILFHNSVLPTYGSVVVSAR